MPFFYYLVCTLALFLVSCGGGGGGGGGTSSSVTTTSVTTTSSSTTSVTTTSSSTTSVTTTTSSTTSVTTTSSSTTTTIGSGANNVVSLTVNGSQCDPSINAGYINDPCVSVTVCNQGSTSTCQTINSILLDTGSYGLRIFKSLLTNVSLTQMTSGSGSLAECVQYITGSTWGPVQMANVILGSEPAVQVPIQVIDYTFPTVRVADSVCPGSDQSPSSAGYNGILGVGPLAQDCGQTCVNSAIGYYYSCSGSSCSGTTVPLSNQVSNPIASLPYDNNGLIVQLPSISASGAPSVSGSIILGIGTETNNSPSGVTEYSLDNYGDFPTTFNNVTYSESFIDTGSNGLFFPSPTSGLYAGLLPSCTGANSDWFCPSSTTSLSAGITGASGSPSATVSFQIGNFNTLTNSTNNVFNDVGGPIAGSFDWGLPFFLGRSVFIGIQGQTSSLGTGPYFAY